MPEATQKSSLCFFEVNPKRRIGKKALKEEASCATINTGGIYMAKKGQKFKKYTAEIKREVLEKYFSGKNTAKMLGEEYGIPKYTIKTWIRRYKQGEQVIIDTRKEKKRQEERIGNRLQRAV